MKRVALPLLAALMLAVAPVTVHAADSAAAPAATANAGKVAETKAALRDLWIDHVFWVRSVVVARADGNKAAEEAAEKEVVANAHSIADTVGTFYGKPAADGLFKLLAGHYGAIRAYLDASVAKDKEKQDAATKQLLDNADGIASFLSSANPNLPKDTLLSLLQAHGGHHMTQINQLLAKDYAGEAKTWDDMSHHMYTIADALVDGIAKQFPEKF